jgi:1,4-dihydroxy-2-naphthoate octaprenyltransferase
MKGKIGAHLVTLPRWFALPAAACAVALGCILGGVPGWLIAIAIVCGAFLMAGAHSFNSFLDKEWTHFDEGLIGERSKEKVYTEGQNAIMAGVVSSREVLINALSWYVLSAGLAVVISIYGSPWVWLPWTLSALCTFFYSWGKMHYLCETALGLGFGSFAVMLGICGSPKPDLLMAFLAGLPFLVLWGFMAEFVDQATDAEPNWPRGLRNLGALAWKNNVSVPLFTGFLIVMAYLTQIALIAYGTLAPETALSLVAFPLFAYGLLIMGNDFNKKGILIVLLGIFVHMILLVVGQAIGV